MTPTETLRQRARLILDALKAAPAPETYAEIIRAARAVMATDKMLRQLWPEADMEIKASETAREARQVQAALPLNRQQRRAQTAMQKQKTPLPVYRERGMVAGINP